MEENIGVLLHKLTKYQTLLSNTGSHNKKNIYSQKINSYSQKLNKIGINQNNINQLGGLIGGDISDAEKLQEKLKLMKERRETIGSKSLKVPTSNINAQVQNIGSRFTDAITALNKQIADNVAEIDRLKKDNAEKEQQKTDLQQQKANLEQQNLGLEQQKSGLEKEKSELEQQKSGLEKEKTELEEKNRNLLTLSNDISTEFDTIAKMFDEYQQSAEQNTGEAIQADQKEISNLENLLKQSLGEKSSLDTEANKIFKSIGVPESTPAQPADQSGQVAQVTPPVEPAQPAQPAEAEKKDEFE
jgi:chromosome segregation ATPase